MSSSMHAQRRRAGRVVTVVIAAVPLGLPACGDDGDKVAAAKATPLVITTSDASSKRFKTEAPTSIKGGLVNLRFTNAGKEEHEAALVRLDGAHTSQELLKLVAAQEDVVPDWVHFAGGAGTTRPGQTASVTLNLVPGKYVMIDTGDPDAGPSPSSRGALAEFQVTAGKDGKLPATTATITATTEHAEGEVERAEADGEHTPGERPHAYEITGLKAGSNRVRFVNKGEEDHHAVLFPIQPGKAIADVEKFFQQQGRPSGPPPVDFSEGSGDYVAAIEGDNEQVTDLTLSKPGKYAVVCFLTDRDGKGKPHFAEGMLEEVDVK